MWYLGVLPLCLPQFNHSLSLLRCLDHSPLLSCYSRPPLSSNDLFSDVSIILLCSLAILGLLFHQMNISIPVDPLEWQISQDAANSIFAWLANTVGAAESVLRVAATAHDKRLFFGVVVCLYILSAIGRLVSGATVAYAGLCLFCLYTLAESLQSIRTCVPQFQRPRNGTTVEVDNM
ncbi:Reticulon-like protein B22 [Hibiscus syriacus]|uniref:Reticulon-like protein B22 n=1 Tax=Hibiscus syriacus TaxID=106335 RepID=A0A6A3A9Z6_HIBSY|nr:reticulon-like protein B22 isoform X1 [Hibiscus syriacus]KAE8700577.1 Reticulon-like protein B22 [Hibiscus syriacus]